eukprot:4631579-Prymnesium_polylepis.1
MPAYDDVGVHGLHIPSCAREIFLNCSMQRVPPAANATTRLLAVDHAYLIHYTGFPMRRTYQLHQLPRLGLNLSVVTGYDYNQITGHNRACLLSNSPSQDAKLGKEEDAPRLNMHERKTAYFSQTIKLYAALYDMLLAGHRSVLIMEDDGVVRFEHLPKLNVVLRGLAEGGNWSIVFSGSYNPRGTDGLREGFWPKDEEHVPTYRSLGRMMPAVGVITSIRGARHVVKSLPISAPIDMALSDSRIPSSPRHGLFYFKPYCFTPGNFGTHGIFGSESASSLPASRRRRLMQMELSGWGAIRDPNVSAPAA